MIEVYEVGMMLHKLNQRVNRLNTEIEEGISSMVIRNELNLITKSIEELKEVYGKELVKE